MIKELLVILVYIMVQHLSINYFLVILTNGPKIFQEKRTKG